MALYAVNYRYLPNTEDGRNEYRPRHVEFLQSLFDAGQLISSGPTETADNQQGALLIIKGQSHSEVDSLMSQDPFAHHRFLERSVQLWTPKFGAERLEGDAGAAN